MASLKVAKRPQPERFEIQCPVTVGIRVEGNGRQLESGELREIGARSATFHLWRPLQPRTFITLRVHLRGPSQHETTLCFAAVVTELRTGSPCEVTVKLEGAGRFLRRDRGRVVPFRQPGAAPALDFYQHRKGA